MLGKDNNMEHTLHYLNNQGQILNGEVTYKLCPFFTEHNIMWNCTDCQGWVAKMTSTDNNPPIAMGLRNLLSLLGTNNASISMIWITGNIKNSTDIPQIVTGSRSFW